MSVFWPTTRPATKLVQSWSTDPSKFKGAGILPDNVTDYKDTDAVSWRVLGPIIGMAPLHKSGANAKLAGWETLDEKLAKPYGIKLLGSIDENDFKQIAKLDDPTQMQRAGNQLFVMRSRSLWTKVQTRKEYMRWKALNDDLQAYTDPESGVVLTIDYDLPAVVPASVDWDEYATAEPVADIRTMLASYAGSGCDYVDMYLNSKVAGYIFNNETFQDLLTGSNLLLELTTGKLNGLFKSMVQIEGGNTVLRNIIVYDAGYWSDSTTYTRFVPDDRVFFIGGMDSAPMPGSPVNQMEVLGEYANTPAMVDGYEDIRPGDYMIVEDRTRKADIKDVLIAAGNEGIVVFYHPDWVKRLNPKVS